MAFLRHPLPNPTRPWNRVRMGKATMGGTTHFPTASILDFVMTSGKIKRDIFEKNPKNLSSKTWKKSTFPNDRANGKKAVRARYPSQ